MSYSSYREFQESVRSRLKHSASGRTRFSAVLEATAGIAAVDAIEIKLYITYFVYFAQIKLPINETLGSHRVPFKRSTVYLQKDMKPTKLQKQGVPDGGVAGSSAIHSLQLCPAYASDM